VNLWAFLIRVVAYLPRSISILAICFNRNTLICQFWNRFVHT